MAFQRLRSFCRPLRYAIELKPCFKKFTFSGKESVSLEMNAGVTEIELNAREITVLNAKYNGEIVEASTDPAAEKVLFRLNQPSLAGPATLDVEFTGIVSDKMEGFYRSHYKGVDGQDMCMMSTQFEPSNARQAFPCWDEPEFKSVFSLKVISPKDMMVISNMPVISQTEQDGGYVAHQFDDTPKMSTYLVAFAIGEMEYVEAHDANGVKIRVYSRPGYVREQGQGAFALDIACRSLPFFGDYFRIQYPLPKLDLLAVPDFASGAMENWGLVTFRERALLSDKNTASASSKQGIALTVSHELAHMWFGNLVTMRWWTDLWLKEGFANCIEYLCVNHCFPEMDIWTQFTGEIACALRLDALESSHPIEVEVNSPSEIDEIFDTISYCKGASVIHMLHAFLGDEAFRAGLCAYLAKYAYKNATTEDLWSSLSEASDLDIGSLMRPWTQTMGFPVLSVEPVEVNGQSVRVRLSQTQYKIVSSTDSAASRTWRVPVVFTCCSDDSQHRATMKHVLTSTSEVVDVPLTWSPSSMTDCVVRVNADASGFYHVRYSDDHLKRLAGRHKVDAWPTSNRFAFINDGFALAKAGFIKIDDWLSVLPRFLEGETSFAVWHCGLWDGLSPYIRRLVYESDIPLASYHKFLLMLTRPALDKLHFFTGDRSSEPVTLSHNDRLLRSLMVMTAGTEAGDSDVVEEARRRYNDHLQGKCSIPGDLLSAVYCVVVRHSGMDIVNQLIERYALTKSVEEKSYILNALGCAKLSAVDAGTRETLPISPLHRVLQLCLDPCGPVRDQDRVHGLVACASWSSEARLATWNAVKADWPHITSIYGGQFLLSALIKGVLGGFATEERATEIKTFFDANPVYCERSVKQLRETVDINNALLRRDVPSIASALARITSGVV